MKLPLTTDRGPRTTDHARRGFSLIEILVTVALLTLIILGLYGMFTQVQRAFRMSMSQVDLLEAGRAVTEMVPRELEQITPAGNLYPDGVNFYTRLPIGKPLIQPLPGSSFPRTNLLQDCFLLLRDNQTWVGIGYCVRTNDPLTGRLYLAECDPPNMGVGSLYRWSVSTNVLRSDGLRSDPRDLYRAFRAACVSGSAASVNISNRICDGVIHFYLRSFATNGWPIFSDGSQSTAYFRSDGGLSLIWTNSVVGSALTDPDKTGIGYPDRMTGCYFYSNAVPAFLELELGILDQRTWDRYHAIGVPTAQRAYLQRPDISTRIQLFRQRVAVRNVDPVAYQ